MRYFDNGNGKMDWPHFFHYLIHDPQAVRFQLMRLLGKATIRDSPYYKDCHLYDSLNVRGKRVLDLGDDMGTTPVYFKEKGAKSVIGISPLDQFFRADGYLHSKSYFKKEMLQSLKGKIDVLKADCEGCEYELTPDFLDSLSDWIICFHDPIMNFEVLDYAKKHGVPIGKESPEIGTYKKVVA